MSEITKPQRMSAYCYLDADELKELDIIVEDGNYKSKTDLVTTLIRYLIHKDDVYAPEPIRDALAGEIDAFKSLEIIRQTYYQILDEYARPALANRGVEIGYQRLRDHLVKTLYERIGKVPDEQLLYSWTKRYCDIHHADFVLMRIDTSTKNYEESCGFDTDYD